MMQVEGCVTTTHRNPACVAGAIRVDNLSAMKTEVAGNHVRTTITGTKLRSVIASVDDYLMNLAVAEATCGYRQEETGKKDRGRRKGQRKAD
jgi:hypothetical protein